MQTTREEPSEHSTALKLLFILPLLAALVGGCAAPGPQERQTGNAKGTRQDPFEAELARMPLEKRVQLGDFSSITPISAPYGTYIVQYTKSPDIASGSLLIPWVYKNTVETIEKHLKEQGLKPAASMMSAAIIILAEIKNYNEHIDRNAKLFNDKTSVDFSLDLTISISDGYVVAPYDKLTTRSESRSAYVHFNPETKRFEYGNVWLKPILQVQEYPCAALGVIARLRREIYIANVNHQSTFIWATSATRALKTDTEPFAVISSRAQEIINNRYLQPRNPTNLRLKLPRTIPDISFPPAPTLIKDQFETKEQFEERVRQAQIKRERELAAIQEEYARKVDQRNAEVARLEAQHKDELRMIEKEQEMKMRNLPVMFPLAVGRSFAEVMGTPTLRDLRYDADAGVMHGELRASNADYALKFAQKMPANEASDFFKNQQMVFPYVKYKVAYTNTGDAISDQVIALEEINTIFRGKTYLATLSEKPFQPTPMTFTIRDVNVASNRIAQSDFDLQNPLPTERIRVEAIQYHERKGAVRNDLSSLIAKAPQAKEDSTKWLFVVGIEMYKETYPVDYAETSAKDFELAARKTLGVPSANVVSLYNESATTGLIKDRLTVLLDRMKEGDSLYFYYCGHGVPSRDPFGSSSESFESYILPFERIPNFIYQEPDFRISSIFNALAQSKAAKVFVFMDACFSGTSEYGSMFPKASLAPALLVAKAPSFDQQKMVIMSASQASQTARGYQDKGHRLFTYFLVKGLLDNAEKAATGKDLFDSFATQVRNVSYSAGDSFPQDPQITGNTKLPVR